MRLDSGPNTHFVPTRGIRVCRLHDSAASRGPNFTSCTIGPRSSPDREHRAAPFSGARASGSVADFRWRRLSPICISQQPFPGTERHCCHRGDGTFEGCRRTRTRRSQSHGRRRVRWKRCGGTSTTMGARSGLVYAARYPRACSKTIDGPTSDSTEDSPASPLDTHRPVWIDDDGRALLDLYVPAYFRSDIDLLHLTRLISTSVFSAANKGWQKNPHVSQTSGTASSRTTRQSRRV